MNTPRLSYFENEDVLHLVLSDAHEAGSVEVSPKAIQAIKGRPTDSRAD